MTSQTPVPPLFALTAPCTKDEFHAHLLNLQWMQLQMLSFGTSDEMAARVLPRPVDRHIVFFDPDQGPDAWKLRYADFRQSSFFRAMDCMYDFAYAGLIDDSYEDMGDETTFMWAAALIHDAAASLVVATWDAFGTQIKAGAAVLEKVVETANARAVLEGLEAFDPAGPSGDLTVRQLALLAGMEEMTIRSAANPKKPNALKVVSTEAGTRVEVDVAKDWLIAKGRYVVPTRHWGGEAIDLSRKSFRNADEVLTMLGDRLAARWLAQSDEASRAGLAEELRQFGVSVGSRWDDSVYFDLSPEQLRDTQAMKHVAIALDLPPDLFVLRIREALANEDLQRVLTEIRTAVDAARRKP